MYVETIVPPPVFPEVQQDLDPFPGGIGLETRHRDSGYPSPVPSSNPDTETAVTKKYAMH